jgi:hypothetical protein
VSYVAESCRRVILSPRDDVILPSSALGSTIRGKRCVVFLRRFRDTNLRERLQRSA